MDIFAVSQQDAEGLAAGEDMYAYHAYLVSGIDSVERRSQEGEDRER
jgi:hypothetical protein